MKKPPTAAERRHMDRVAGLGCVVCLNLGYEDSPAEIHHIKHQTGIGRKSSNFEVLPLCPLHHRNGGYGIAFDAGRGLWEHKYGSQLELLEQVRGMLDG